MTYPQGPGGGQQQTPGGPQYYAPQTPPQEEGRPGVNAGKLWAGGVATAIVAALVGLVGLLLVRGVFNVSVLLPSGDDRLIEANAGVLMISAAVAAILRAALLHVLLLSTPSPTAFFGWIVALVTVALAIVPFLGGAPIEAKAASAAIIAAIGIAIGSLLIAVAHSAQTPPTAQ